jgi:hypothetical protein
MSLWVVLEKHVVCVRHSYNREYEDKDKVTDVLYHIHQHPDVVACLSENSEKIEKSDPHDNCCEWVQSTHYFRLALVALISFG